MSYILLRYRSYTWVCQTSYSSPKVYLVMLEYLMSLNKTKTKRPSAGKRRPLSKRIQRLQQSIKMSQSHIANKTHYVNLHITKLKIFTSNTMLLTGDTDTSYRSSNSQWSQ